MIEKILHTPRGSLTVRIPTILNEITLGKMMALEECAHLGELETISLLSGVAAEDLYEAYYQGGLEVFQAHIQSLGRQIRYLYESAILPRKVSLLLGKRKVSIKIIRHLSVEPAGAFLAARDIIAEEINRNIDLYGEESWREHFQPSLRSCCSLLSQYFFCRATGKKYDEVDAVLFADEVQQLKVTDALPIARHFFSAYPDLLHQHFSWAERLEHYWRRRQVMRRLRNNRSF